MTKKLSKTLTISRIIGVSILLGFVLFALYFCLRVFVFDIEQRGRDLDKELKKVAMRIEDYKIKNGAYPNSLRQVDSEKICSKKIINFCTKVHYKIVENASGYRLAAKSLSWPILYYH